MTLPHPQKHFRLSHRHSAQYAEASLRSGTNGFSHLRHGFARDSLIQVAHVRPRSAPSIGVLQLRQNFRLPISCWTRAPETPVAAPICRSVIDRRISASRSIRSGVHFLLPWIFTANLPPPKPLQFAGILPAGPSPVVLPRVHRDDGAPDGPAYRPGRHAPAPELHDHPLCVHAEIIQGNSGIFKNQFYSSRRAPRSPWASPSPPVRI